MTQSGQALETLRRLRREASVAVVLALVVLAAGGMIAAMAGDRPGATAIAAAALFATAAAALLRDLPRHAPHARFGAANRVTLARLALVAWLAGLALDASAPSWGMVALAGFAAALDGIDGWLARRHGTTSGFGARFDMETDQLLIVVLALAAWRLDQAGGWVLLAAVPRYAFVAAARARPWLARPLPDSRRRKAICVAQIVALIVCIAPVPAPPWSAAVAAGGLAALCYSFALDVAWLRRRARSPDPEIPR